MVHRPPSNLQLFNVSASSHPTPTSRRPVPTLRQPLLIVVVALVVIQGLLCLRCPRLALAPLRSTRLAVQPLPVATARAVPPRLIPRRLPPPPGRGPVGPPPAVSDGGRAAGGGVGEGLVDGVEHAGDVWVGVGVGGGGLREPVGHVEQVGEDGGEL